MSAPVSESPRLLSGAATMLSSGGERGKATATDTNGVASDARKRQSSGRRLAHPKHKTPKTGASIIGQAKRQRKRLARAQEELVRVKMDRFHQQVKQREELARLEAAITLLKQQLQCHACDQAHTTDVPAPEQIVRTATTATTATGTRKRKASELETDPSAAARNQTRPPRHATIDDTNRLREKLARAEKVLARENNMLLNEQARNRAGIARREAVIADLKRQLKRTKKARDVNVDATAQARQGAAVDASAAASTSTASTAAPDDEPVDSDRTSGDDIEYTRKLGVLRTWKGLSRDLMEAMKARDFALADEISRKADMLKTVTAPVAATTSTASTASAASTDASTDASIDASIDAWTDYSSDDVEYTRKLGVLRTWKGLSRDLLEAIKARDFALAREIELKTDMLKTATAPVAATASTDASSAASQNEAGAQRAFSRT